MPRRWLVAGKFFVVVVVKCGALKISFLLHLFMTIPCSGCKNAKRVYNIMSSLARLAFSELKIEIIQRFFSAGILDRGE